MQLVDSTTCALLVALLIGCIPPLKHAFVHGPLSFSYEAALQIGRACVMLSTLLLGASLYCSAATERAKRQPASDGGGAALEAKTPRNASDSTTLEVAIESLHVDGSVRRRPTASSLTSFRRVVGASIAIKLLAVPAVAVPLTTAAARAGWLPDEPILLMVLHIQSAVPSAQAIVSLLAATGKPALGEKLSTLYIPMYTASLVTVAVVITVAVEVIGPGPVVSYANLTD
jgi:hypothetical protein